MVLLISPSGTVFEAILEKMGVKTVPTDSTSRCALSASISEGIRRSRIDCATLRRVEDSDSDIISCDSAIILRLEIQ
jgi:hypothetical protein